MGQGHTSVAHWPTRDTAQITSVALQVTQRQSGQQEHSANRDASLCAMQAHSVNMTGTLFFQ